MNDRDIMRKAGKPGPNLDGWWEEEDVLRAIALTREDCAKLVCFWCRHQSRPPVYDDSTGDWVHYLPDGGYASCEAEDIHTALRERGK